MPVSFLEVEPRSFQPMSVPGLTNEAREAVNAALKAMSNWRNEMAHTGEKNGKQPHRTRERLHDELQSPFKSPRGSV